MASAFLIKGLGDRPKLKGTIRVAGAKNAALQAMAFSILFKDTLRLSNVPEIEDISRMTELLEALGLSVRRPRKDSWELNVSKKISAAMPEELTKKFRASVVLTGPLLSRFGRVSLPHPGGCLIGARPIDLFLEAYKKMGAKVTEKSGCYDIAAPKGLHGAEIFMRNQSVTGTQTVMMAAILAKGQTVIKNAAMEPEIPHLAAFLNKCGAKISGAGTPTITIKGGGLLSAKGRAYKTPPDRIETGSFLILGVLAAKDLTITNCQPKDLEVIVETLRLISSSKIITSKNTITVKNKNKAIINPLSIKTHEYPGFPTDLQAPMAVLLSQARGESLVFETIFEGRLGYAEELARMGAKITLWDSHRLMIFGPRTLSGKILTSPDIRAGLALVLAAVIAKGESVIHNAYYIDRGYEAIEKRFLSIGVPIKRIETAEEGS